MKRIILLLSISLLIKISIVFGIASLLSGYHGKKEKDYVVVINPRPARSKQPTALLHTSEKSGRPGFSSFIGIRAGKRNCAE